MEGYGGIFRVRNVGDLVNGGVCAVPRGDIWGAVLYGCYGVLLAYVEAALGGISE